MGWNSENYYVLLKYYKCVDLSHEWWVLLIKFMMRSTIHVREKITYLCYSEST